MAIKWTSVAVSWFLPALAGCARSSDTPQAARDSMAELRALAVPAMAQARGSSTSAVDTGSLRVSAMPARTMAGVTIYRVLYAPRGSSHMATVLHAARRDTALGLVRSRADIERFAAGAWVISDSSTAVNGCAEIAGMLGQGAGSELPGELYLGSSTWRSLGYGTTGPSWRDRVSIPRTELAADGWRASLWMVESGRLTKYECTFSANGSLRFVATDSLLGAGRPPERP